MVTAGFLQSCRVLEGLLSSLLCKHDWLFYNVLYTTGFGTMNSRELTVVQCTIHKWLSYNKHNCYTSWCSQLTLIHCTLLIWLLHKLLYTNCFHTMYCTQLAGWYTMYYTKLANILYILQGTVHNRLLYKVLYTSGWFTLYCTQLAVI